MQLPSNLLHVQRDSQCARAPCADFRSQPQLIPQLYVRSRGSSRWCGRLLAGCHLLHAVVLEHLGRLLFALLSVAAAALFISLSLQSFYRNSVRCLGDLSDRKYLINHLRR